MATESRRGLLFNPGEPILESRHAAHASAERGGHLHGWPLKSPQVAPNFRHLPWDVGVTDRLAGLGWLLAPQGI
jgi:hypothetical protein